MGFILRTIFWLGLAMVVIPPQARLGGDDTADLRAIDLGREAQHVTNFVWSIGGQAMQTCETNQGLCQAGQDLWATAVDTAGTLATEAQNQWQKAAVKAPVSEPAAARASKKIQARVE
jgi:hypothetical protein